MRPLTHWVAAMLLVVTSLGAAAQPEEKFRASGANAGLPSRYRVHLALKPGDELETVIRQLTATYGGRLEPYAEVGFEGFMIVVSETRARLLSSDPRVAVVEEMPPAAVLPRQPEARVTVDAAVPRLEIATEAIPGFGTYAYDGSGNITSIGDASGTDSFFYDRLGRLQSTTLRGDPCRVLTASQPCRTQEYTYDRYGNILTILTATPSPAAPIAQIMAVDPVTNQLDNSNVPDANVLGTYDGRGNLVSYNSGQLVYDALDLVTEVTVGGTRRMHLYSASDERVVTVGKVGSTVTGSDWTIRDAGGRVLRRLSQAGNGTFTWAEDYVYRDGQLLAAAVPAAEKVRHFHLDHLGTPRLITGNGGAEIAQHQYFPFGVETSSSTNDGEKAKFTGHERDAATLDYMHARYYDPYVGRFFSVDPVMDLKASLPSPQRWNRYSYVSNSPINKTDPDGRDEYAMDQRLSGIEDDWERDRQQVSFGVSFIPRVGDAYDVITAITGRDMIGGQNPPTWARAMGLVMPFLGAGFLSKIADGNSTLVIGKIADLQAPGALRAGESTLVGILPATGSYKSNWTQNARALREVMRTGKPIRDASVDPLTGKLINNSGILRAERNLLRSKGWTYDENTRMWNAPR